MNTTSKKFKIDCNNPCNLFFGYAFNYLIVILILYVLLMSSIMLAWITKAMISKLNKEPKRCMHAKTKERKKMTCFVDLNADKVVDLIDRNNFVEEIFFIGNGFLAHNLDLYNFLLVVNP
uniref:ATP synthase F0 subunit 8 n=1 Tax=Acrobeloides nanus TaxID=290746 RepID=A0A914CLE4_9BILA